MWNHGIVCWFCALMVIVWKNSEVDKSVCYKFGIYLMICLYRLAKLQ